MANLKKEDNEQYENNEEQYEDNEEMEGTEDTEQDVKTLKIKGIVLIVINALGIFSTIFCCPTGPLGIVGLVFAILGQIAISNKEFDKAQKMIKISMIITIVYTVISIIVTILTIGISLAAPMMGILGSLKK